MNNKPRPKATTVAPAKNAPRPPVGKLDPQMMTRLNSAHIKDRGGDRHVNSINKLHEQRAYMYDKMSKNEVTGALHDVKARIATNLGKTERSALSKDAESLRPFKREFKENNPEGARWETAAKGAKYTKTAMSVVNHAGTAVSLVNPVIGGTTKLAAKGAGIAAGAAATMSYHGASKAYAANVDENATGRDYIGSQLAQVRSDINAKKRNNMAAMTGVSAVLGGAGIGVSELANAAGGAMEVASKTNFGAARSAAGGLTQLGLEHTERERKSEFVNLLQIRKGYEPKRGLNATPKAPTHQAPRPPGAKK